ncbi:hypothetical protein [Haladaptatus sp. W1]|uniref:hypothetical protein n=1 Tax=Haladaptatus sp. W1 TaxID=1897478 RepID=UPI0015861AD7|nr:hypothetical protein [Haladaptatus sp. W1]
MTGRICTVSMTPITAPATSPEPTPACHAPSVFAAVSAVRSVAVSVAITRYYRESG